MKKRLHIWITIGAILLALSATALIVAAASGALTKENQDPALNAAQTAPSPFSTNAKAPAQKTEVLSDGSKVSLQYENSLTANGQTVDHYTDEKGLTYTYDQSGNLIGVRGEIPVYVENKNLPDETIVKDAYAKAVELFGKEEMANYQYVDCLGQANSRRYVIFARYLGDGNYLRGPEMNLSYEADGTFAGFSRRHYDGFEEFDPARLKNYDKATLDQKVKQEFLEFANGAKASYNVKYYQLIYKDGTYYVQAHVEAQIGGESGYATLEIFEYPIK